MPITKPIAPFVAPNGDVTLRSSDQQDFQVVKAILTIASSFFKSMFSLPQPEGQGGCELPVIPVTEDSTTLDTLLRLCYPVKKPIVTDINLVEAVLGAALKYEMEIVVQEMCRALVSGGLLESQPLRVYAIACRYELDEEMRLAAKATLKMSIEGVYVKEFETLPTSRYFHLLQYRSQVTAYLDSVLYQSTCTIDKPPTSFEERTGVPKALPKQDADAMSLLCRCFVWSPSNSLYYSKPPSSCKFVADFWVSFASRARNAIHIVPHNQGIYSQEFLRETLQVASKCEYCSKNAAAQWNIASEKLRAIMDDNANEVQTYPFYTTITLVHHSLSLDCTQTFQSSI
ncbi:hypothetical protein DFH11DRAFT_741318 [Phellopilus nigrolimitatus]|nr:hypothetical protein DFH11DRAFT_741318 [Phellopilus nigrolimitatus]